MKNAAVKKRKTMTIVEIKRNIEYLLRDWKHNIKCLDIVVNDITNRVDTIRLPKDFDFSKQ